MLPLLIAGYLALCVAALFSMQTVREKPGALWLWLPVMLVPPVIAASLLGVLPAHTGSGPDGGAVSMASGFYLMVVLPVLAPLGLLWLASKRGQVEYIAISAGVALTAETGPFN